MKKPYAIIHLRDLRVIYFDHKDDWLAAVQTWETDQVPFVALKYHNGVGAYQVPEVHRA